MRRLFVAVTAFGLLLAVDSQVPSPTWLLASDDPITILVGLIICMVLLPWILLVVFLTNRFTAVLSMLGLLTWWGFSSLLHDLSKA